MHGRATRYRTPKLAGYPIPSIFPASSNWANSEPSTAATGPKPKAYFSARARPVSVVPRARHFNR